MADTGRGHYKIFLGMAAGVGKTYRMLQEGHAALADGRDVVIGILETLGRVDTAALTAGPSCRRWTCPPSSSARPSSA